MLGFKKGSGLLGSVSIRNLTFGLVAFTLLFGSTLFFMTWRVFELAKVSDDRWSEYHATSNEEVRAVSSVMAALGYGGMIHNFKNFVLRRDQARSAETQRRIGALAETLDQLSLIDISTEELQAVGVLRDAVLDYGKKLEVAQVLAAEGKSATEIDAQVRYDDKAAIAAVNLLLNKVLSDAAAMSRELYPPVQLVAVQHALGYGGVIHHFKNYILRQDDATYAAFSDAAARAQAAIEKYRTLKITTDELRALDVISAMVAAYERRMQQAVEMRADGMTPEQTDNVVIYDDGPALAALSVLERALVTRSAQIATALSQHLSATEVISLWSLAWAAILSLLLSAGILAVLRKAVVMPSQRIAEGLERLSEGDTDVDLSDLEARNEIGAIARAAGVFRDRSIELMTLREEMLSDSRAQTKSIVDAAADAILSTDGAGRIESANPAAATLFNAGAEDLIGRNIDELLDLPAPRAGESALEAFLHRDPEDGKRGEVEARRRGDGVFPAKLALGKVQLRDRLVYTAIVTDLTETKKIERMKSEFVSTVSHELRTPLTSIKGSLGLLKASVLGDMSVQARAMIDIAYNNCDRLVRLINDILDVEKIEAGKLNFDFEAVDIAEQIERVIKETSSFATGLGIKVVAEEIAENSKIEADSDRLSQVLTNLVSNAVKFSPKGGTVRVSAEVDSENRLRVSVADNGPGITEDFKERIFQKFAQNDGSDTRKVGGTGLGLSISKAIIEAHGGKIGFDTEVGKGSTFWFEMPIMDETGVPSLDQSKGLRPRVLICEDDPDVGHLLTMIIGEIGFDTELVTSTAAAEARLKEGGISAMTVDIGLPDRDGMSLIQDLRASDVLNDIPVVVVSAQSPKPDAELAGDAFKIFDWLKKPIDVERLRDGLLRAVEKTGNGPLSILHIDDDPEHVAIVAEVIGDIGASDVAWNCKQARECLLAKNYDLVILDLLLPDGRGESLISAINANGKTPPQILVFSIQEPDHELMQKVDGVLVKSHTSNTKLKAQLEKLLKSERKVREIETFT